MAMDFSLIRSIVKLAVKTERNGFLDVGMYICIQMSAIHPGVASAVRIVVLIFIIFNLFILCIYN